MQQAQNVKLFLKRNFLLHVLAETDVFIVSFVAWLVVLSVPYMQWETF
jgi:hypothetical protein